MKTINANTIKGQSFINAYNHSTNYSLEDCYTNPSHNKVCAFRECLNWCNQENGKGFKVIGYNCNFFTVAWRTENRLRIETAYNSYIVK